jgi:hypothetical protein
LKLEGIFVEKFVTYMANEWAVVSQAPFSFIMLAVIMFGIAYLAAQWRFTAVIDQVKASNETRISVASATPVNYATKQSSS